MAAYIVRRLLQAIPVLFLISLISFWLMEQAPGGPTAQFTASARITPEMIDAWLDRWCLERIARFKRPKEYRFVDALPKNHYGKVLKTELRRALP